MRLHLAAVVENEIDALGNLGDGFEAILADFETENCGEAELPLGHDLGSFAEEGDALLPAQVGPVRNRGLGGFDGLTGFFGTGALEFAQQDARVGGGRIRESSSPGFLLLSADVERMRAAEFLVLVGKRRVKRPVKVFPQ